jgi:urease beta subunit
MIPGEYILADAGGSEIEASIEANIGRERASLLVANSGDRPIQVGSHFHFFEVNRALRFARETAYGMRLDVPAGTAVRFEPGEEKLVALVALGGRRIVYGMNALVMGALDAPGMREAALAKASAEGYLQ